MDKEISAKITEILIDKIGVAETEVTPDANFIKDLGIDSLDYAELVMEFEQAFDIKIPDSDSVNLETFHQAVNYIQDKLSQKN